MKTREAKGADSDRLRRVKFKPRVDHSVVLEDDMSPMRKLAVETRNVWSPSRRLPPVLRGFSPPPPRVAELGFNPRGDIHVRSSVRQRSLIKDSQVAQSIALNNSGNQTPVGNTTPLGYPNTVDNINAYQDDSTLFTSVKLTPGGLENAQRVARIAGGFSP